ncbi:hypothetical protein GW820_06465 [archaeon]|nr:hypothetical protein [archaeon]
MHHHFFKKAYGVFITKVVKKCQTLTPDQLHKPDVTARSMIKEFNKILADIVAKDKKQKLHKKYPPLKKHKGKEHH